MNYLIWITAVVLGAYGIPFVPSDITGILLIPLVWLAVFGFNAETERKGHRDLICCIAFTILTAVFSQLTFVFPLGCAVIAFLCMKDRPLYFVLPSLILIERTAYVLVSGSYHFLFGNMAMGISELFTEIFEMPIDASFSFWGIHYIVLLIVMQIFVKARRGWLWIAGISLIQVFLVAVLHSYLFSLHIHESFLVTKNMAILQFIPELLFICGVVLLFARSSKSVVLSGKHLVSVFVLIALCVLSLVFSYHYKGSQGQINKAVIYSNGMMDFSIPNDSVLGTGKTGMFGLFKLGLEKSGVEVQEQKHFPDRREDADLLIIINPISLPEGAVESLKSYLKSGGNVLVLGDHTDIEGSMEVLNGFLRPLGLEYHFDSGMPLSGSWESSYDKFNQYDSLKGDTLNVVSGLSTGATLSAYSPFWEMVVSGRYFFGDYGNRLNLENAFLGDYAYQRGERIGDVPLVVQRSYGKGKIMVFGDTSTFQNVIIGNTWPFISEIMSQFESSSGFKSPVYVVVTTLLLLLCVCWLSRCPVSVIVILAILNVFGYCRNCFISSEFPAFPDIPKVAILKNAHNRFTEDNWEPHSVMGLNISTYRAGLWPFKSKTVSDALSVPHVKAFIFIEPMRSFSKKEIKEILNIGTTRPGAIVIFSIGPNSYAMNREFYDLLGVRVSNMSLGTVPIHKKKEFQDFIKDAYTEIQFSRAFPLELNDKKKWEILYQYQDYPLIVRRNINGARFMIIGDSEFLWDRTLESEKEGWPANIKFYMNILKEKP